MCPACAQALKRWARSNENFTVLKGKAGPAARPFAFAHDLLTFLAFRQNSFCMSGLFVRLIVGLFAVGAILAAFGPCPVLADGAAPASLDSATHHAASGNEHEPEEPGSSAGRDQPASHCAKTLSLAPVISVQAPLPLSVKFTVLPQNGPAALYAAYLPEVLLRGASGRVPIFCSSPFRAFFAQTRRMLI